jgi:transcriptional regulator with XRE-family HTH domain
VSFTPPIDALHHDYRPRDGWISCGWIALEAWARPLGLKFRDLGTRFGCASGTVHNWKKGERTPTEAQRRLVADVTGGAVDVASWLYWLPAEGIERDPPKDEAPPSSRSRAVAIPELGKTPDEIKASVRRCKALAQKTGLSPTQQAQLEAKVLSGLGALARLEERSKIEDHPDFDSFTDLIHVALERTLRQLGVDPAGVRSIFADHLEAAEAEQQRRAA